MTTKATLKATISLASLRLDQIKYQELIAARDIAIEYDIEASWMAMNQALVNLTEQNCDYYHVWVADTNEKIEELEDLLNPKTHSREINPVEVPLKA